MLITAVIGLCCNLVNLFALDHDSHSEETASNEKTQDGASSDEIGYDNPELFSSNESPAKVALDIEVSKALGDSGCGVDLKIEKQASENMNMRAAMIHILGDMV